MIRRFAIAGAVVASVAILVAIGLRVRDHFAPGVRGSGTLKTETFDLERFDQVTLVGVGTARIDIGEPQLLEITTDDNLFALLSIGVKEGTLAIRSLQEIRPSELLVKIRVPDLRGVALAGYPTVEVPSIVRESFGITIAGHGIAKVSGKTDSLKVKITGNGLVLATGLAARRAEVEIAGAGDVELHASDALAVTCYGSGHVRYRGEPKLTSTGDASVERLD